ncbi:MAG: hypothetical protein PHP05_09445 [Sideroxydans sp.]|uniref:hypothetical protein n=1 Tax=Acidithiobacillus ferrooxidans TaxID=920 RepID=UPI0013D7DB59|nr:hypothetical protein [Acidithiobacillus ferrooxidans]MDD5472123.1 hypothetical protein [Sideroxydans sp.]
MTDNKLSKVTRLRRTKAPRVRQRRVNVPVSDAAWQALQQLNIHYGTVLSDTIETLAIDAELRTLREESSEHEMLIL